MTTDNRVAALEAHIDTLHTKQADLRRELRKARVDQWQDRIDDLDLQVRLGVSDGGERLTEATRKLQSTWDQVRGELLDASSDAADAADALRDRMQTAYSDVRTSLLDTKNRITR